MKPTDILLEILLRIIGVFTAMGIAFVILLSAIIIYPIYYWRVTMVALIVYLGVISYLY